MNGFKIGDRVLEKDYPSWGVGTILGFEGDSVAVRFDDYPDYDDDPDYCQEYGQDSHTVHIENLRKRTLAEKRADDAKVLGAAVDRLQETLASGGRSYYGGDTVLRFIEDMGLGFSLGNAVKYVARAGKKSADTACADLRKAVDYIEREIARIEGAG